MPGPINKLWIAVGLPAILVAAIGATVAFAQDDGAPSSEAGSTLLQQEPTPSTTPEQTPPDGGDSDGDNSEKDCPRDGGSGTPEGETPSGSSTGISFRRR